MAFEPTEKYQEHRFPFPVSADIVIEAGDFVYYDGTTIKAASSFTYDTSDKLTRQKFRRQFAGVALTPHRVGDPAGILQVATICEGDIDAVSGSPVFGDCVGLDVDATPLLEDQKVELVKDAQEAIGQVIRHYGTSITKTRILVQGMKAGLKAADYNDVLVKDIYTGIVTGGAIDLLTNAPARNIFGGAVEILAVGFRETIAITTKPAIFNLEKGTTNLASLTVPVTGAAIGRVTETSMEADSSRVFEPDSNISLEMSGTAPGAGSGTVYVRYRKLS